MKKIALPIIILALTTVAACSNSAKPSNSTAPKTTSAPSTSVNPKVIEDVKQHTCYSMGIMSTVIDNAQKQNVNYIDQVKKSAQEVLDTIKGLPPEITNPILPYVKDVANGVTTGDTYAKDLNTTKTYCGPDWKTTPI